MPFGVVFWTGSGRDAVVVISIVENERLKEFDGGRRPTKGRSGTKEEMNRQTTQESEEITRTERSISSVGKENMIFLFNFSNLRRRLPFYRGIFQFWMTNQEQSKSTFTQRKRETESSNAVDDKSKKFDKKIGELYDKVSTSRSTRTIPHKRWVAGLVSRFVAPALCYMPVGGSEW